MIKNFIVEIKVEPREKIYGNFHFGSCNAKYAQYKKSMLLTDTPRNCVEFIAAYISSAISLSVYVKSLSDLFFHLSRSIVLLKASATLQTASYASGAS
jgi:hypothetical protein